MIEASKPMIAMLIPDLRCGGGERVAVNLAGALSRRGFNVDLVLMSAVGELLDEVPPKVRIIDLGVARMRHASSPLARYLHAERPRALIAHMWPLPLVALRARAKARLLMPVLAVEHTTWSRSELFARLASRVQVLATMRLAYHRLDAVAAVSAGAADDLARISGLPRERVHVLYNPITGTGRPSSRTSAPDVASAWSHGPHRKVLAVGTLKAIKDYPTLLRAFSLLRSHVDAKLLILGEGDERVALERLVDVLNLRDSVFLPGNVEDPSTYFSRADLHVLTSTGEGFGNVIVEALEQGTPIVSTDCPSGPREILEDGKYGTLVPVGDVDALARAMEEALSREHDRDALRRRAQDFSVDKAADAYLDLLIPGWRDGRRA